MTREEKLKKIDEELKQIDEEITPLNSYLCAPGHGRFIPKPDIDYINRVGKFNPRWKESILRFWELTEREEELKNERNKS